MSASGSRLGHSSASTSTSQPFVTGNDHVVTSGRPSTKPPGTFTQTSTTTSPARPTRSRLRNHPPVPASTSTSARHVPALRPLDTRRVSSSSMNSSHDHVPSPMSLVDPGQSSSMFSDPFEADRSHRSELRAHANAAVANTNLTHSSGSGQAADKLRNAVGAFMSAGRTKESSVSRPIKSTTGKLRSQELWEIPTDGNFREIDQVLQTIREEWPFILESDFSSSTLALSLLSQTSDLSGSNDTVLASFLHTHEALSAALQSSVQSHFQSFAASLPAHAAFISTLGRAQQQVKSSKESLREARDGFGGKGKTELDGIKGRERQIREMLDVLDTIDHLKQVPGHLESLIGEKRFLQAATLLVQSTRAASKPEMASIGVTSDLRTYLAAQKSAYNSDIRWRPYVPGQNSLPNLPTFDEGLTTLSSASDNYPDSEDSSRLSRYLSSLGSKSRSELTDANHYGSLPSGRRGSRPSSTLSNDEATQSLPAHYTAGSPESNVYRHIETILESLSLMGSLGSALEMLVQRVGGEVFGLVESTLDEVEDRSDQVAEEDLVVPSGFSTLFAAKSSAEMATKLQIMSPPRHIHVLRDVMWTLYSKMIAVLEGHRVIYEVAKWISTRRDFIDTSSRMTATFTVPVIEIWRPIQQEIRSILQSYLLEDREASLFAHQTLLSINELLRDNKIARDRQTAAFRFNDSEHRAIYSQVRNVDEGIQATLGASVPGLAGSVSLDSSAYVEDSSTTTSRHRNLVPANAFNISTLFQPTLAFIARASSIAPSGFEDEPKAFGDVLEDFVVKVFLPQLDDRVTAAFQDAVSGHDAFQVDRREANVGGKPPLKSTVRVMALIQCLCFMLQTTPFQRENYSRLVIGVIVQYYQQCSTRFKELVSCSPALDVTTSEPRLAIPAVIAQREDYINCLTNVRSVTAADIDELFLSCQHEVQVELDILGDQPVTESQLINSHRKVEALAHLSQSLRWLIDSLLELQDVAPEPAAEASQMNDRARPSLDSKNSAPRLPLTQAMAQRYEAIVQTFEQLTEMIQNTLRLEVRMRSICNLTAVARKGDFRLESEALEPDPDIVDLSCQLIEMDKVFGAALCDSDHRDSRRFIFKGLSHLLDHVLISSSRFLTVINKAGVHKIRRNIVALQQVLRAIQESSNTVLVRAMEYWDLYEQGPKAMLEGLRTGKPMFGFEEYNTMLKLQCQAEETQEASSSELNTYLIDLHALSMSIDGWEIGEAWKT